MDNASKVPQTMQTPVGAFEERPPSSAGRHRDLYKTVMSEEARNQRIMAQDGLKQLEQLFENCQSLLREMRDITVGVVGNFGEVVENDCQQQLERCQESFENKLQLERERGARKIQAARVQCQELVLEMATTVKEYFKKTMEESRKEHKQELEEARREGIEEGMRRQRDLLLQNMVCSNCNVASGNLFVCTGCWSACYCGQACQTNHWQTHMKLCHGLRSSNDEEKLNQRLSNSPCN